jgi:hypothetical protein
VNRFAWLDAGCHSVLIHFFLEFRAHFSSSGYGRERGDGKLAIVADSTGARLPWRIGGPLQSAFPFSAAFFSRARALSRRKNRSEPANASSGEGKLVRN